MKRIYAFLLALLTCGLLAIWVKALSQASRIMPIGSSIEHSAFGLVSIILIVGTGGCFLFLIFELLLYALREEKEEK